MHLIRLGSRGRVCLCFPDVCFPHVKISTGFTSKGPGNGLMHEDLLREYILQHNVINVLDMERVFVLT